MAPFEPSLRARIGRWVQQDPALESAIGRGLAIDDIVEEVFLLAFESWEGRPSRRRLGLWLEDLIPEAVEVILRNPDEARRNLDAVRAFRELPRE